MSVKNHGEFYEINVVFTTKQQVSIAESFIAVY